MGPADHHVHEGQARICTEQARKGDIVVVQEKLDGSCVAVAKINGEIVPLIRAGYRARDGRREFQHQFDRWAMEHADQFDSLLMEGERVVGEWLALAHGTRYRNLHSPFVAFDLMVGDKRATTEEVISRCIDAGISNAPVVIANNGAVPLADALAEMGQGRFDPHPDDGPEGVVYRVERYPSGDAPSTVDFLAKWVNPAKVDGKYLPELSGHPEVWNWTPEATP